MVRQWCPPLSFGNKSVLLPFSAFLMSWYKGQRKLLMTFQSTLQGVHFLDRSPLYKCSVSFYFFHRNSDLDLRAVRGLMYSFSSLLCSGTILPGVGGSQAQASVPATKDDRISQLGNRPQSTLALCWPSPAPSSSLVVDDPFVAFPPMTLVGPWPHLLVGIHWQTAKAV